MDAKEIQMRIERVKTDIEKEVRDRLPRKVGVVAVNHFRQNFRDAGWRDNGLHPGKRRDGSRAAALTQNTRL